MGLGFWLLAAFVFGPPIYQFSYFSKYYTISRGKAFLLGFGYWTILTMLLFFPILFVYEYGTVAMIITGVIAFAITGVVFYRIFKKRSDKLAVVYPEDKFIAAKEMIACIGMLFGSILIFMGIVLAIFLPFMRKRD